MIDSVLVSSKTSRPSGHPECLEMNFMSGSCTTNAAQLGLRFDLPGDSMLGGS